jgi:hypothetical protein
MKLSYRVLLWSVVLASSGTGLASASPAVDTLLEQYRQQGVTAFDAMDGQNFWVQKFNPSGTKQVRQCATCHTANPRNTGKHARTGKPIEPMAPTVNSKRLTEVKEIRKWLYRNCKWTVGRECTPQEKGNLLIWMQQL